MRVISSPSSSTTGFFTTIFSPKMHKTDRETKARRREEDHPQRNDGVIDQSKLSFPARKTLRGKTHDTTACCSQILAEGQSL
jgi:hypothetical protein